MKQVVTFRQLDTDTGDKYWDIYYLDKGKEFHKRIYTKELKGVANTLTEGDTVQFDLDDNYYITDIKLVAPDDVAGAQKQADKEQSESSASKLQQSAVKNVFFAWGCGKLPDTDDLVQAALNWCRDVLSPWAGLIGAAKAMGATPLSLYDQFKEACRDAALDTDTKAGAAAVKKWLTKKFPSYETWEGLSDDAQKEAIAEMKKAKVA